MKELLIKELHYWLEGSEHCRYHPKDFCPHSARAIALANKLEDMGFGWIGETEET